MSRQFVQFVLKWEREGGPEVENKVLVSQTNQKLLDSQNKLFRKQTGDGYYKYNLGLHLLVILM